MYQQAHCIGPILPTIQAPTTLEAQKSRTSPDNLPLNSQGRRFKPLRKNEKSTMEGGKHTSATVGTSCGRGSDGDGNDGKENEIAGGASSVGDFAIAAVEKTKKTRRNWYTNGANHQRLVKAARKYTRVSKMKSNDKKKLTLKSFCEHDPITKGIPTTVLWRYFKNNKPRERSGQGRSLKCDVLLNRPSDVIVEG